MANKEDGSSAVEITDLPYRPCVGIALFNAEGKVFVGERIDNPGAWQMPQGGIDAGEDTETAAFRELEEETGIPKAMVKITRVHTKELKYDLPPHLLGKLWKGKFCGQSQTWVAMQFLGEDKDIDIACGEHCEFSNWKWVWMKDILETAVPFKFDVYKQVITAFAEDDADT